MDYFYDGQIRRYVTQFMRVFIGFKYKTGGDTPVEKHVPVMYGDLTRQVASIIKDNSENKNNSLREKVKTSKEYCNMKKSANFFVRKCLKTC